MSFATIQFIHDYADRLIGQTLDTDTEGPEEPVPTYFAYENGQIVFQFQEDSAGDDLTQRNLWGPQVDQLLAAEEAGGEVLWPLADQVGSIRDIAEYNSTTNETTVTNHRQYDSFGNLEAESDAAVDLIFGYTGRLFNEATGLQNNLHRWYDARIGQFVSEDPIGFAGDPSNLYRYVGNSPLNAADPTGLETNTLGPITKLTLGDVDVTYGVDADFTKNHSTGDPNKDRMLGPDHVGVFIRLDDKKAGQPVPGGGQRVWASAKLKKYVEIKFGDGKVEDNEPTMQKYKWYKDMPGYRPTITPFFDYAGFPHIKAIWKHDPRATIRQEFEYAVAILCQNPDGSVDGTPLWEMYYKVNIDIAPAATGRRTSRATVWINGPLGGNGPQGNISDWSKLP